MTPSLSFVDPVPTSRPSISSALIWSSDGLGSRVEKPFGNNVTTRVTMVSYVQSMIMIMMLMPDERKSWSENLYILFVKYVRR